MTQHHCRIASTLLLRDTFLRSPFKVQIDSYSEIWYPHCLRIFRITLISNPFEVPARERVAGSQIVLVSLGKVTKITASRSIIQPRGTRIM